MVRLATALGRHSQKSPGVHNSAARLVSNVWQRWVRGKYAVTQSESAENIATALGLSDSKSEISLEQFQTLMEEHTDLTHEESELVFKTIDFNGHGRMNMEEFLPSMIAGAPDELCAMDWSQLHEHPDVISRSPQSFIMAEIADAAGGNEENGNGNGAQSETE